MADVKKLLQKSSTDKSSEQLKELKKKCQKLVTGSEFYKPRFESVLIAAMNDLMKNAQDQLFFETANLVTNTPPGSNIPKTQLLTNLVQFVYGDKKNRVSKTAVDDSGRFKNVIFLTILTHKKLLEGKSTQNANFKEIRRLAGIGVVPSFQAIMAKSKTKGCKKIKSGLKTELECSQKQWANVYQSFSDSSLRRAVKKIVFEN